MAWQFWPALSRADRLLVPAAPLREYLEYLTSLGFELPGFGVKPDPDYQFTPFGWNDEAADLNRLHKHPADHPDPAVVARVNSREFTLQLERELFPERLGKDPPVFCRTSEVLATWLENAGQGRKVAKGNHGHAGIGQLRFIMPAVPPDVREKLTRILETQGGLALEDEHDIVVEFGCLFLLHKDGSMIGPRCHRLLSYSGGGFAGALRLPEDPEFQKWRNEIEPAVKRIGERLHREGYFGPVGIDAYAFRDGERVRFRPLVDLNARCSMAFPVHGLSRRFPDKAVLVSQVPSTIRLPANPEKLRQALGELHFDPETKRGAFLITPLMPGPRRHAWAFIGKDEADVLSLREKVMRVES